MKVLHTSDLHGRYHLLLNVKEEFDVWIDTGDFFPNSVYGRGIQERDYQHKWFVKHKNLDRRITDWLGSRASVYVPGNHDFEELANLLPGIQRITPQGLDIGGLKLAGFRQIPYINGYWNGEIWDFTEVIEQTLATNPDVLVTHSPPHTILDEQPRYGITLLTSYLLYKDHNIRHHLFGHCHLDGGKTESKAGIKFYNGAECARIHTIE